MRRNISISIRAKLALGFGLIVAIVLVLQVLGYRNVERLAQANEWDRHTLEVLLETEKIATSTKPEALPKLPPLTVPSSRK